MRKLIAALGKNIRPSGKNWAARCPVHQDKDFAMSIKQAYDGSVVAHCHACLANGLDLYRALGLDLDELFGYREHEKPLVPHHIREEYEIDKMVVVIHWYDESLGRHISYQDKKRYRLAIARITGIEEKYNVR